MGADSAARRSGAYSRTAEPQPRGDELDVRARACARATNVELRTKAEANLSAQSPNGVDDDLEHVPRITRHAWPLSDNESEQGSSGDDIVRRYLRNPARCLRVHLAAQPRSAGDERRLARALIASRRRANAHRPARALRRSSQDEIEGGEADEEALSWGMVRLSYALA